jgi:hypothetical protein
LKGEAYTKSLVKLYMHALQIHLQVITHVSNVKHSTDL